MRVIACSVVGLLTLCAPSLSLPQAPSDDDLGPATSNIPGAEFPQVSLHGRAVFRLNAPQARTVVLKGGDGLGKGPFPMSRDKEGVWSVSLAGIVPGFHYYWFDIEGLAVNDPGSETFFGYSKPTSGIEVPERAVEYDQLQTVPHGDLRAHYYFSKTTGKWRRCYVYTPPGYDNASRTRYPVLYLQHGAGENETSWGKQGRVNIILDNLLASGRAKPILVVMDFGYADFPGKPVAKDGGFEQSVRPLEHVFVDDLILEIDSSYRTLPDREHRAMAGLSMGGMQALLIGLENQDQFAWIGAFSAPMIGTMSQPRTVVQGAAQSRVPSANAAPGSPQSAGAIMEPGWAVLPRLPLGGFDVKTAYRGAFADPMSFNSRIHLLWFGTGTSETFMSAIQSGATQLKSSGIRVVLFESPETAHEWLTWRRCLSDFVPRLFH